MLNTASILRKVFNDQTFHILELILSPECNLQCTYCYMKRHNLKHQSSKMDKETIAYAVATMKRYRTIPFQVDLFGGEPLLQLDLVEYVLELTKDDPMVYLVNIPTNAYVVANYPNEIQRLYHHYPKLALSFSIDGPYSDPIQRRPLPEYSHLKMDYDVLFALYHERYRCGFHPMIYAETVHYLFDTFKFFVENVLKGESPDLEVGEAVYFLQVRNGNTWTKDRVDTLIEESKRCLEYIKANRINGGQTRFNFLRPGKVARGLTCSLQTQLTVAWDGKLYPCHRLIYPEFLYGDIFHIEAIDISKFLLFHYFHRNNNLICSNCRAFDDKGYCCGGCLGAQYEYWGDPFIPIPDVCYMLRRFWREVLNDLL